MIMEMIITKCNIKEECVTFIVYFHLCREYKKTSVSFRIQLLTHSISKRGKIIIILKYSERKE